MKTRKFYPIFAGIFYLISSIFLFLRFFFPIDIFFTSYKSIILVFLLLCSWFFVYVLLTRKRNKLLPISIITQMIYFVYPDIGTFLGISVPLACSFFIIYVFILSIIFKKQKNRKTVWPLIIIWFILFMYFYDFTYYILAKNWLLFTFIIFYTLAWIFILLWILSPCKNVKTEKTATYENKNQQFSQSSFSNNNQPQQVKQYYSGQQYNEFNQYNNRNQQSNTLESNSSISQCKKNNEVQENKTQHKHLKQCPVCFSTVSDNALFCEICGSKLK